MEALFTEFSFVANQALDDKNFDPSKIDDLLNLFEREAYMSWSAAEAEHQKAAHHAEASMREADDYLNSLMDAAMDDFRRSHDEIGRSSSEELSRLVRAADAVEKMGHSLGASMTGAAKKYMDGAVGSAMAAMKSAFSGTAKIHPS